MHYGFSAFHFPVQKEVYSMIRSGPAGLQAIGKEEIQLAIIFLLPQSLWNELGKVTGLLIIFFKICCIHLRRYLSSSIKKNQIRWIWLVILEQIIISFGEDKEMPLKWWQVDRQFDNSVDTFYPRRIAHTLSSLKHTISFVLYSFTVFGMFVGFIVSAGIFYYFHIFLPNLHLLLHNWFTIFHRCNCSVLSFLLKISLEERKRIFYSVNTTPIFPPFAWERIFSGLM